MNRYRQLLCVPCILIAVFLASARKLTAYEVPLLPASLHDACVLGQRNDQATADFFNAYAKQLKEEGALGAHIAEIDIFTPFAQVADECRKNAAKGYNDQQAEQAYRKRGDIVVVRVLLMFPAAYPKTDRGSAASDSSTVAPQARNTPLRPENFWQNFQFSARQHGKVIATRSIHNQPIYSAATKDAPSVLDGATVWLEYDAKDLQSDQTTIEVVTPEAQMISATFDLKKLR